MILSHTVSRMRALTFPHRQTAPPVSALRCPSSDSNRDCPGFESGSSNHWDRRACAPWVSAEASTLTGGLYGCARHRFRVRGGIRTHTVRHLKPLPPAVGLHGRSADRTRTGSIPDPESRWSSIAYRAIRSPLSYRLFRVRVTSPTTNKCICRIVGPRGIEPLRIGLQPIALPTMLQPH